MTHWKSQGDGEKDMNRPTIYLAGPAVFRPDAVAIGKRKVAMCEDYGFEGLYPLDNEVSGEGDEPIDQVIYEGNVAMILRADMGVFDLTPHLGISADVGTAFELGMFAALRKPAFGHTTAAGTILERAKATFALARDAARGWRTADGTLIEDFENRDNLMLDGYLDVGGNAFIHDDDHWVGFERCLREARATADRNGW